MHVACTQAHMLFLSAQGLSANKRLVQFLVILGIGGERGKAEGS